MQTRYVKVETLKGLTVGYVSIDMKQYVGNLREYCHDQAMRFLEINRPEWFGPFGSKFQLSTVTKNKPSHKKMIQE